MSMSNYFFIHYTYLIYRVIDFHILNLTESPDINSKYSLISNG